jgi:hypothetical protein
MQEKESNLDRHDLRWLWLAITMIGAAAASIWLASGGELYRADDPRGVAAAAATTARFAVLLAICAAAIDAVGMLAAARTHYVSGFTSLVCGLTGLAALGASVLHAQAASEAGGYEADPLLKLALGAMIALAIGGFGLWLDARAEHRRAEHALARVEHDIHAADHDLM